MTVTQDVELALTAANDPQFARDWDDTTPLIVASWNAGTRLLTFTTARPASMAVGHRLVVDNTSGVELEIESLSSTNAVVLVDANGQTPTGVGSPLVYSGGPIIEPARDAVAAIFDELGPRVGDFGYGNWVGTLRRSSLYRLTQEVDGVNDVDIVTPVGNVEPTAESPLDGPQVYLLVPGAIVVRYV